MNLTTVNANRGQDPLLYELRGVLKSYGSAEATVRAVDGIDLTIVRGEFVVIAGPSGSGKSTLLQLLGALDRPSAGTISFEGRNLSSLPDVGLAELRLRTLGFIFQQFNLIPTLTALENVEVALAPTNLEAQRARSGLRSFWSASGSAHAPNICPRSSPVVSSKEWPLPAPWPTSPRSCWPTSRPATSTQRPAMPSWPSSIRSGRRPE